jgi:hypothetical protein
MNNNLINLGVRSDTQELPSGVKGLFYLYYKTDNDLYVYDSFRDHEWNLFNLTDSNVNGEILFVVSLLNKGSIKFNLSKQATSKIVFNLTKISKGTIKFSLLKTSKGTIKFSLSKLPAVGDLIVNIKEVL